jgi:hypothetical protein
MVIDVPLEVAASVTGLKLELAPAGKPLTAKVTFPGKDPPEGAMLKI